MLPEDSYTTTTYLRMSVLLLALATEELRAHHMKSAQLNWEAIFLGLSEL